MKQFFILFLTVFLFTECTTKNQTTDWSEFGLKGKVKSMRVCLFTCPVEFGKVDTNKLKKLIQRFGIFMTEYLFDNEGYLIEKKTYFEDGTIEEREAYRYDIVDGIKRKVEKNKYDKNGEHIGKTQYEYDKSNNSLKVGGYYYKYNTNNDLIEERYADEDSIKINYFYDSNQKKTSMHYLSGDDLEKTTYKYEGDRLTYEETVNDKGEIKDKFSYKCDKNGNNIEVYDLLKDKIFEQTFLDSKNNATSIILFDGENDARFKKKEITYF